MDNYCSAPTATATRYRSSTWRANARTGTVAVGKRPFGITIDAAGKRAYTANVASDDVSIIDIASGKLIGTVPVGHRPYAVALAGQHAYVTNQYASTLSVIDIGSLKVVQTIAVGDHPEGIAADPAGANVYVACWFDNVLMRIDTAKMAVTGEARSAMARGHSGCFCAERRSVRGPFLRCSVHEARKPHDQSLRCSLFTGARSRR